MKSKRPMTAQQARAWLTRHGYRDTSDGWGGWMSFTDDDEEGENAAPGYYYCKTEQDIIGLVKHLQRRAVIAQASGTVI